MGDRELWEVMEETVESEARAAVVGVGAMPAVLARIQTMGTPTVAEVVDQAIRARQVLRQQTHSRLEREEMVEAEELRRVGLFLARATSRCCKL